MNDIRRVAVIGAGTMGHGIAQVAALAGWDVTLTDALTAALTRISLATTVGDAVAAADLVIEAVVEDLHVKRALFADVASAAPSAATLATNTSSLSVARIAEAVPDPGRVVGMHFFNPVHVMKLVEVVTHDASHGTHVDRVVRAARAMGKEPIVVRDAPGFAS